MSLRWRFAIGLGAIVALVGVLIAVGAYVTTAHQLESNIDESLRARVDDVLQFDQGGNARGGGGAGGASPGFERPVGCPPAGFIQPATAAQRIDESGEVLVCIEGGPSIPVDRTDRALASVREGVRLRTVTIDGTRTRVITATAPSGGALQVARSLSEVEQVLDDLRRLLILLTGAGVIAAVLLGWFFARRVVRPIDALRDTAERIARTQDLATPVSVEGSAEVGSLARSFTAMVDALAISRREQERLISDASHELRTPLTSLRTNTELLARRSELDPAQYDSVVEGLALEVDDLTALVTELVELATDRTGGNEEAEATDLGELARDVAARAERRSGRAVAVRESGESMAMVRPQMIARAISNLVDNALKYSPAGTPVEIVVAGTRVEVLDEGPGIPEADRPLVFDRFYRSVEMRTQPGSGLGLAIVKQAVEQHGGTVWAAAAPSAGAAVGFELPPSA